MSIELTEIQQKALDREQEQPPRFVDPRTNAAYVLVNADEYEQIRVVLEEERWRANLHPTAMRNAVGRMNEEG
jgi:hypothetical protein